MMLPCTAGAVPMTTVTVDVSEATTLRAELRISEKPDNHTPDVTLATLDISLTPGKQQAIPLAFAASIDQPRYVFLCLLKNDNVALHLSDQRLTGILALCQAGNKAVAKSNTQSPPPEIGIDSFEFWTPKRRPAGKNLALRFEPALQSFGIHHLTNGVNRPTRAVNAWVADFADQEPVLRLTWQTPQTISLIELDFDTDFDHPMESVLMGHPERCMPFCIGDVEVEVEVANGTFQSVATIANNHQSRRSLLLSAPFTTTCLRLRITGKPPHTPAAIFAVRCYA
jgi:hypothetical protein